MSWNELILWFLIGAVAIQLFYFLFYFSRLAFYKEPKNLNKSNVPVSVVVVARNELDNLQENLKRLLKQDYPNFEVVVVNNGSWDKSLDYLESLKSEFPHLSVCNILDDDRYPKGKKFGLTMGIKAAKHDWLLLTDADCKPTDNKWIQSMSRFFTDKNQIVLGYSPFIKTGGFFNLFARFESFYTALQYLSFALAGKAYMGVGRNLAYRKSMFFEVKGLASHNHIISGDDSLFVNENANNKNTTICIAPDSFTVSPAKTNLKTWLTQKKRHMTTGKFFKTSDKWRLAWLNLSHILFYVFFVLSLVFGTDYLIPLVLFAGRLFIQWLIFGVAMFKLKDTKLIIFLPFMDILYFIYYSLFGFTVLLSKKKRLLW